ncbi:MAG TPA: hypothetical protein DHW81_06715 [Nitrospiraceae bacterium]|nr:hypothetical protein [Nitrospiraceae bacterium]
MIITDTLTDRHSIDFGKTRIDFTLTLHKRKSLRIDVHPDKTISVFAPMDKDKKEILSRIKRRAPWIIKQQRYFDQFHPLSEEKRYLSGETHSYLGRQYRLKIIKGNNTVKLMGRFLKIFTKTPLNGEASRQLLDEWYLFHAKNIFEKRVALCSEKIKSLNIPIPRVQLRKMKKRWGSCKKSGEILLNTELVKAPVHCIDYVIMHELCHLKIHLHNERYFRLLSIYLPDWKKRKERLEKITI